MSSRAVRRLNLNEETSEVYMEVPIEVAREFYAMCQSRGIEQERMFSVMVKAFANKTEVYGLQDTLKFGKYGGVNVEDLIRADPQYCRWAIQNTERFDLTDEAYELLEEIDPPRTRRRK